MPSTTHLSDLIGLRVRRDDGTFTRLYKPLYMPGHTVTEYSTHHEVSQGSVTLLPATATAADINAALIAADAAGGGVVQLLAGTFPLAAVIDFTGLNNVCLRGAGRKATVLTIDTDRRAVTFDGTNGCGLEDLRITGPVAGTTNDAIHATNNDYLTIRGVVVTQACRWGIYLENGAGTASRNRVESVSINDCRVGGLYVDLRGEITDVDIYSCLTGLQIEGTDSCCKGLLLNGNTTAIAVNGDRNSVVGARLIGGTNGVSLASGADDNRIDFSSSGTTTPLANSGAYNVVFAASLGASALTEDTAGALILSPDRVAMGGAPYGDYLSSSSSVVVSGSSPTQIASIYLPNYLADGQVCSIAIKIAYGDVSGTADTQDEDVIVVKVARTSSSSWTLRNGATKSGPLAAPSVTGTLNTPEALAWEVTVSSGNLAVKLAGGAANRYAQCAISVERRVVVTS